MRKISLFFALLLVLSLTVSVLASCGDTDPCTDHVDADGDLKCDKCGEAVDPDPDPDPEYETITIAEALELCGEPGNITEERYYIRATVKTVTNAAYGAMVIVDDSGEIAVYGTYSADGELYYSELEETPVKGDEVLLHCILQNFNGTKEVKNARLIEFKKGDLQVDPADYTDMTISAARDAAEGAKIKIDGVVAAITYSNGMKPAGIMLVDETQSIYVYDADLAQQVKVGNKVTVIGTKAYWILESEMNNAAKFGYKGCCQLDSAYLISNDNKTDNAFDKSWITESTVKAMMDTPVTENVTTAIYKVTALIKKAPGSGFVNYYINDLDGTTGSYTYTQCNGSDFAWLDEFDGKICTVYLTALNAKSTSTACNFRFLPVAVIDEGFEFDLNKTAEHVVKYYAMPQFLASYSGNPNLTLVSSISSELLGFTDAEIVYTSSNTAVVSFAPSEDGVIFTCSENGKATVTASVTYNGTTYSESIEITVAAAVDYDTVTVADAIAAAVNDEVIIRGIVGPSLVNKSGFYLFDESGMVAVVVKDVAQFDLFTLGDEVIIKGKRDCFKDAGKTHAGQTAISNAEILSNFYGDNDYPVTNIVTDKDLQYICGLDVNEDYSTTLFRVTATVTVEETKYYTNIYLTSGSAKLLLYSSSASQYNWLKAFANQEVTLEVAPCNWNNKSDYRGCVLAVITEDGKVYNTLNFTH